METNPNIDEKFKATFLNTSNKVFKQMHQDIAQIIESQNQKISDHFDNFQDKLLTNLKKMRLGALHQTVVKIIDTIQNAEMQRIRIQSEHDNIAFRKIFRDGLTEIILTLPT